MSVDDDLRPIFRRHLPMLDQQSVETGGVSRGVPDTNWCCESVEGWIEFKATSGYTVDLRPEQIGWIARRVRHGGRVHVAVRRRHDGGPRRGPPVDELWIAHGVWVKELRTAGLRSNQAKLLRWTGGPARWDWSEVLDLLMR